MGHKRITLQYFEKADCDRYRVPSVDMDDYSDKIKDAVLEMWKKGSNIADALDAVLEGEIFDSVAGELEENLLYQQKSAFVNIAQDKQDALDQINRDRDSSWARLESTYNGDLDEKRVDYEFRIRELNKKKNMYSARERSLAEMRARLDAQLEAVGGKEGYGQLQRINAQMDGHRSKKGFGYKDKKTPIDPSKIPPPLPNADQKSLDTLVENEEKDTNAQVPAWKRFLKKTVDIFVNELW